MAALSWLPQRHTGRRVITLLKNVPSSLWTVRLGDHQGHVPGEIRRVPEGGPEGRVRRRLQAPPPGDLPLRVRERDRNINHVCVTVDSGGRSF